MGIVGSDGPWLGPLATIPSFTATVTWGKTLPLARSIGVYTWQISHIQLQILNSRSVALLHTKHPYPHSTLTHSNPTTSLQTAVMSTVVHVSLSHLAKISDTPPR